ncbi:uncharacterized protein F4812DRAFT_455471 [Daldinia caldariorum]|uniref:uncharacterized protein n=1 Tax=Daldinia caldariorum TaxID=326644 RepID=UPI002007B31B|nr:uncharacterized protein F4812DRAFT_455471 [Daldinia caldariorum]KAI1471361.1 hypothetical protein F4812DRAFT_455471 [Daldinia caldariorum]
MAQGNLEQQEGSRGSAYALELTESQQSCSRRHFASAEELRADIQHQQEEEPPQRSEPRRRLLVLHRLSADYTRALTDLLDVDAGFIDAHVGGLSYRPLVRRRRDREARFVCFEYPELLTVPKGLPTDVKRALLVRVDHTKGGDDDGDIVREPFSQAISDEKAVVFCRASLWQCAKTDVLLLDRPIDDEMPGFESLLYRSLSEEWRGDYNGNVPDMRALVQDLAAHQWSEFFDAVLSSNIRPSSAHQTAALYWQAQKSLERNLSSSEIREKSSGSSDPYYSPESNWESLLSRLGRHVALLSHLAPISASRPLPDIPPPRQQRLTTKAIPPTELIPRRHYHYRHRARSRSGNASTADDQNKHALDRVSYMGGILLPLSVVSSILSMSDPFGPTGPLFYVFWAAAVPLVFVAVLVIYADSIRKAEVWIEVAGNSNSSNNNDSSTTTADISEEKQKQQQQRQRQQPEKDLESQSDMYGGGGGGSRGFVRLTALGKGNDKEEEDDEEEEEEDKEGEGKRDDSFDEPVMMVEKLFKDTGGRKWQREQLGWGGACMTALRIYKLKKGKPPNWVRHGRTA